MRAMSRRILRCTIIPLFLLAVVLTVKYTRWYVLPKRFAVVEPGQVYRGGYTEPWPLARMIERYGIRTIVSLNCLGGDDSRYGREQEVVRKYGLMYYCFPMPGTGLGDFDLLDRAADVLSDPANHPVFVHCAAGVYRTSAACAAWRMKHCGWTFEQAMEECEAYGLDPQHDAGLYEHLRTYYEQRVLPLRSATTRPVQPAG
jgi:protein tyrosine/serine phosphatase